MRLLNLTLAALFLLMAPITFASTWVQVEGEGDSVDAAKQNAFRNAIQFVVGQVIVSDVEVNGDNVVKDFIGSYSAGYVDNYEIRAIRHQANKVILDMNVSVASSKIAQRMRSSSNHQTVLAGEKLQSQIDTNLQQRANGDRLLSDVFGSYPNNAYIVNSGATEVIIGSHRQVYIDIPYEIRWSQYWLEAIIETLSFTAIDSKSCINMPDAEQFGLSYSGMKFLLDKFCGQTPDFSITHKNPNNWLLMKHNFYFPDFNMLNAIKSELRNPNGRQHIGLFVDLKDSAGSITDSRCAKIYTDPLIEYITPKNEVINLNQLESHLRPKINGQISLSGTLRIDGSKVNLSDVVSAEMHIEKTCN